MAMDLLLAICIALAPILAVEGSNSQALALAPSYNEQLIHQINAARQMAVNKLAASLGTGTGTAHFDGVPGTRYARQRKQGPANTNPHSPPTNPHSPPANPHSPPANPHRPPSPPAHARHPSPPHQPAPTPPSYGPSQYAVHGVMPTPVYPTSALYAAHPHRAYSFQPNAYHQPQYQGPTLFAAFKAPTQAQIYPSGAATYGGGRPTGGAHGQQQSYSGGANAYLRTYRGAQTPGGAPPRPHGKSASNVLGYFGYDAEPFMLDEQAKLFGYDNSVQQHYMKVMQSFNNKKDLLFGAKKSPTPVVVEKSKNPFDFSKPNPFNPVLEKPAPKEEIVSERTFEETKYGETKYGETKYDPPKFELPKFELPKYEPPKYQPPKYEPPKYEPPKYQPPKHEPPKYEPPKYEPPKYEPPKYEPPKTEKSKYEEPTFEEPLFETPHYEEPKLDANRYNRNQYSPEPIHNTQAAATTPAPPKPYHVAQKSYDLYKHLTGGGRHRSYLPMHAFVPVAIHGYGRY